MKSFYYQCISCDYEYELHEPGESKVWSCEECGDRYCYNCHEGHECYMTPEIEIQKLKALGMLK